jgi:hypothetical protein
LKLIPKNVKISFILMIYHLDLYENSLPAFSLIAADHQKRPAYSFEAGLSAGVDCDDLGGVLIWSSTLGSSLGDQPRRQYGR